MLTLSVTARASLTGGTLLFNTATLDGAEPEHSAGNNTAFNATSTARRSDRALTLSAPTGPFLSATVVTYTLTVTNTGPSDDTDVIVAGTCTQGALGAMAVGGSRVIHFVAQPLTTAATTVVLDISITGDTVEADAALWPNQATAAVDIVPFQQWLPYVGHP